IPAEIHSVRQKCLRPPEPFILKVIFQVKHMAVTKRDSLLSRTTHQRSRRLPPAFCCESIPSSSLVPPGAVPLSEAPERSHRNSSATDGRTTACAAAPPDVPRCPSHRRRSHTDSRGHTGPWPDRRSGTSAHPRTT